MSPLSMWPITAVSYTHLVYGDDHEQGGHGKVDAGGVNGEEGSRHRSDDGTENPIGAVSYTHLERRWEWETLIPKVTPLSQNSHLAMLLTSSL